MFTTHPHAGSRAHVWIDGDPALLVRGQLWTPWDRLEDDTGFGRIELPWEPEPRPWAGPPGPDPLGAASAAAHLDNLGWRARLAELPTGAALAGWLQQRPTTLATTTSPVRPSTRGDAPAADDFGQYGRAWANTLIESMTARQRLIAHLHAEQLADIADLSRAYPGLYEELPAEIGMALHTHEVDAGRHLDLARRLTTDLTATWHALHTGTITLEAATAIHQTTDTSAPDIARKVEAAVLRTAPDQTPRRIRRRCHELIARYDPANVKERHRKAAADRTITRQLAADGMASLTMWAPAQNVAVVWHALTTLGRDAKTPQDGKTAGNRRCDALTDLCRDLLAGGTLTFAPTPGSPTTNPTTGATGTGTGTCAHPHSGRRPISVITVTVPHTVLLGSDAACDLTGFGTITADQARELIAHDTQLRRLLLDPTTHQVLDVGRTTYRPPAHIADHVRARDLTCAAPGCDNPATDCDLDHRERFSPGRDDGGPTSSDNLAPLCRHHHRSKDHGGSTVERTPAGYRWTTPLGRTYLKIPPTLYEPGDSDGPLSGPGNGYIPLWARPHQQPDGTITNPENNPTNPPTGNPQDSTDQVDSRPERDNDPPPF